MKILVTGSEGFVGTYLVKELIANKHNVFCIDKWRYYQTKILLFDLSKDNLSNIKSIK